MNKISAFIIFALVSYANISNAADGSSGCGPGWYIFKENSILSSALRVTTNTVLFPVTTIGMTVGTSNCTRHKLVLHEKETLHFVEQNYYELKTQAARGGGSHVTALAQTMGCTPGAEVQLARQLQKSYQNVFPAGLTPKPDQSLVEVYRLILQNTELSQMCDSSQLS